MYTLDVPIMKALFWGNWKSTDSYLKYVDPGAEVAPVDVCDFFGVLLPDGGAAVRASLLRQ
jgi:hypothetical protein